MLLKAREQWRANNAFQDKVRKTSANWYYFWTIILWWIILINLLTADDEGVSHLMALSRDKIMKNSLCVFPAGKIAKKSNVYFWLYGIAFWIPSQQKHPPPVLCFSDFAGWVGKLNSPQNGMLNFEFRLSQSSVKKSLNLHWWKSDFLNEGSAVKGLKDNLWRILVFNTILLFQSKP